MTSAFIAARALLRSLRAVGVLSASGPNAGKTGLSRKELATFCR